MKKHVDHTRITQFKICYPLLIGNLLRISLNSVDVLMISAYSTKAIAAVSLIGQLVYFIDILFMMITTGTQIIIGQLSSTKKINEISTIISASIHLVAVFSIVCSVSLFFFTPIIINFFHLDLDVAGYASQYFHVFSVMLIAMGFNGLFSSILRAYGYTKHTMIIGFGANITNIIGNYLSLFSPFNFPVLGMKGVAASTMISHGLSAISFIIIIYKSKEIPHFHYNKTTELKTAYKLVLKYGIPNAGELLTHNIAQLTITYFISGLGTIALATNTYINIITRYIIMVGLSLGQGTQVLVSILVGKIKLKKTYTLVQSTWVFSVIVAFFLSIIISLFRYDILKLMTKDVEIISLGSSILVYLFILETGRTLNLIFGNSLKGTGDVNFPVRISILTIWGIGVTCSWYFSFFINIGLLGIWIGIAADEWIRGLIMLYRWKSKKWIYKRIRANEVITNK